MCNSLCLPAQCSLVKLLCGWWGQVYFAHLEAASQEVPEGEVLSTVMTAALLSDSSLAHEGHETECRAARAEFCARLSW